MLTQYNQLQWGNDEAVKKFLDRFNKIYNSLLKHYKPPEGMSKLHYAEGFEDDFTLLLRERRSATLVDMMNDAIEVEVNMMASKKGKYTIEVRKVKEEQQPSTSQNSTDAKFDSMMKVTEKLVEKLFVDDRHVAKEQNEPQIKNTNFRQPRQQAPPPQILQRGQRNHNDQVRPPFQENLLDDEFPEQPEDHINQLGDQVMKVFVTKKEDDKFNLGNNESKFNQESDDYQKGYQNAMIDLQRQLSLRNRDVQITNLPKKVNGNRAYTSQSDKEMFGNEQINKEQSQNEKVSKDISKEKEPSLDVVKRPPEIIKEIVLQEKIMPTFNFENKISKIKQSLPFNEILKNFEYRAQLVKILKAEDASYFVNLQDDILFYISLRIHNMFLHNTILDLGASHNLMPKIIMDNLGLDIARTYKDLFSFDSRKVKCLGLIKDLVVSLHQMPEKSVMMGVVVVDVPVKFGMLLSRSWVAKLKGTLQMDMSYATIPIFGEKRRLYRENRL